LHITEIMRYNKGCFSTEPDYKHPELWHKLWHKKTMTHEIPKYLRRLFFPQFHNLIFSTKVISRSIFKYNKCLSTMMRWWTIYKCCSYSWYTLLCDNHLARDDDINRHHQIIYYYYSMNTNISYVAACSLIIWREIYRFIIYW